MKAFLSHSSLDAEFVEAVARELGRQYCVFDKQVFRTGDEFKASIEQGLDDASVFVLFASRKAMESVWVKFEIDEAWFRKLHNKIATSLVYLIDSSIAHSDLPEWLQRGLIRSLNSPQVIARDIREHLNELLRERQSPYYVGRTEDLKDLEAALLPIDGSTPPHAVFVTGLPGIGRRSLIKNAIPKILSLRKHVEIRIKDGDSISDICIRVADRVEPYSTRDGLERIVAAIKGLSEEDALKRTLNDLQLMVEIGELPILFDDGGLLDPDGEIRTPMRRLLKESSTNDILYVFLVSSRKPQNISDLPIPIIYVKHLKKDDSKRLIATLAARSNLIISASQVSDLSTAIGGYPPAAHFVIQQAKAYGIELVLQDKGALQRFMTSIFLKHFSRLNLNPEEQNILRLLASYSPLPLPVIAKVNGIELKKLQETLIRLIDLSLIITTDEGHYRIADPVADAAVNAYGYPTEVQHGSLAKNLDAFLIEVEDAMSRLELESVLFKVSRLANDDEVAKRAISLASELITLTETSYHMHRYEDAIKFGQAAVNERPDNFTALSFLIKALIQEEQWGEAEDQIVRLRRVAPLREAYFLRGFLERRRGNITNALREYKEAERLGQRGAALGRELALCHFLLKDQAEALKYITESVQKHGDNPYVIDLWIQIATEQKKEPLVRKALERLQLIDEPQFFYHRLSRVELAFGNMQAALAAARESVKSATAPTFVALDQLIVCEISTGNVSEAQDLLAKLDKRFPRTRRGKRLALRCMLEIRKGHYSNALDQSNLISDKNSLIYKVIRRDALIGELRVSALKDDVRGEYEREVEKLKRDLGTVENQWYLVAQSGSVRESI